jgi:hypothetical protein
MHAGACEGRSIVRRKVKDVMTADVAYMRERTPYKELVRLLAERRVSALPMVDVNRHVIGIVSEADLLLKQQHPAGDPRGDHPRRARHGPGPVRRHRAGCAGKGAAFTMATRPWSRSAGASPLVPRLG